MLQYAEMKERRGKMLTIGYLNQTLAQEWAYVPWNGIVMRAERRGARLLSFHGGSVGEGDPDRRQPNVIYDLAKKGRLDGLVVWKGHLTERLDEAGILSFYRSYGVPTVTIEGLAPGFPGVTYGNREGMRLITDHLIEEHGHRSIGFVGVDDFHAFAQRLEGYKESLAAHGLAPEERLLSSSMPWKREADGRPPHERLDPWLRAALDSGVRAFIGVCDPVATWIMERAESFGLGIPRDLAVVGFDGFPSSLVSLPSLTTVNPDWEGLGARALDAVLDIIAGARVQDEIRVVPRIVRARSCGCAEENVLRAGARGRDRAAKGAAGGAPPEAGSRALALLPAYEESVRSGNPDSFLDSLDEALGRSIKENADLQSWQDAITELSLSSGKKARSLRSGGKACVLIDQARILVSDAVEHAETRAANGIADLATREQALGQALITSFDRDRILDALAPGLPGLGVRSAWLSLYEKPVPYAYPDAAPEMSRLVLAVKDGARTPLPADGLAFRSRDLVPDGHFPESPGCYVVEPIRFHRDQIGFIVMSAAAGRGSLYGALATQISAGLQGTRLVGEMGRRSAALEEGVAGLSVSGERMLKSVEAVSASLARQAEAVREEAASIEELDRNIHGIAGISKDSLSVSGRLDGNAKDGAASLKVLLKAMDALQGHSKDILGLIGLIQEFADSTKLLAFNAAVEAAHLGAAGRGFNVIAKDIRGLAESADSNAKRINDIVGKVADLISEASGVSRGTASGLDAILEFSSKNSEASNRLSAAMEEQSTGVGVILDSTRILTDITAEIDAAVREQTEAMEDFRASLALLRNASGG
jgi:DNA-binding LacI/PurR family transcriptional regulator